MLDDVRYALRTFRKAPLFSLIAIVAVALGIGANTAVFSIVDAVLLKPLVFSNLRNASRLVMVWEANPALTGFLAQRVPVSLRNYIAWRKQAHSFQGMGLYQDTNFTLTGLSKPEQLETALASTEFFDVIGVRAAAGRLFTPGEARQNVAVLSDSLYRRRFGAEPSTIGRTVILDGAPRTIVGVLPATFQLPAMWEGLDQKRPAIWIPLDTSESQSAKALDNRASYVIARLRPGVELAAARAEMGVIAERTRAEFPQQNKGFAATVFPLAVEDVGANVRRMVVVLQAAVGLVLLIACANIANLLLTRAAGREREMALRMAIGAPRSRIIRQLLTESLLLSTAGGMLGLLLAAWALGAVSALAPPDVHGLHELRVDRGVLLFTAGVMLLAGMLFGLAPALHAGRTDLAEALGKGGRGGRGGTSRRVRQGLAAVEVALAVILLIGAGLLVRTFRSLLAVDPGFHAEHVLRARISLPGRYDVPRAAAFCRELLDRETALPGVVSASLASGVPMSDLQMSGFRVDGAAEPKPGSEPVADVRSVSETYFETLGMRLLRGRSFTRAEAESSNATAIVVNQALAAQFWPVQDAIGESVTMDRGYGERRHRTIVGVVYDTRQLALGTATRPEIFFPSREFMEMSLVVKTAGDPLAMTDAVSRQVWAIDRDQPVYDLAAMRNIVQGSAAQERFNMSILSALSGLSLVLAVVGLYGILAYGVSLRTRELGVRLALGAEPPAIIRLVLGEGLRVAVVGSAIGVAASLTLSHLVSGLLYGVTTTDPLTFITMPLLVIALALAASYSPARRASRLDPMESLRQ